MSITFEERLTDILIAICRSKGYLIGEIPQTEDIALVWRVLAPEYMADAVPEFNQYPEVSLSWAAYVGAGVASIWDTNWNNYASGEGLYKLIQQPRGFDYLDEYVSEEMLGLKTDEKENRDLKDLLISCAQAALNLMKKEAAEEQSIAAFDIFAKSVEVLFLIGSSLGLEILGYKMERQN